MKNTNLPAKAEEAENGNWKMHMNTLASRKLHRMIPVGSSSHSFIFTWTNRRDMLETVPEIPMKIRKDIGPEKSK